MYQSDRRHDRVYHRVPWCHRETIRESVAFLKPMDFHQHCTALRSGPMRSLVHKRAWLLMPLVYTVVFSVLSLRQHASFHTHALDMGQFDQAIWNTAHGRFMVNTLKPPNTMAWHFSPGLALLAPLYWIWPDARLLLTLQTVMLAASGIPLYWYARRHLDPWSSGAVLAAYYLNPNLHQVNLVEFRRIALAVPGIALAWYGLVTQRYRMATLASLFALLFKEDVSLIVICFGVYLRVKCGRRWGLGLAVCGAAWLLLALLVFMPMFGSGGEILPTSYPQLSYFSFLSGKTTAQAVAALLRRPWILLAPVAEISRVKAVLRVLWPTGFLPLLAPDILALLVPSLLLMLSSSSQKVYLLQRWYTAPFLPLFYGAAVVGITRLPSRARCVGICWLLGAALLGSWLYSPALGGQAYTAERFAIEPRHRVGESLLRSVPPEAVVSAQSALVPHLSHRREIHSFPIKLYRAEYVALDLEGDPYPLGRKTYLAEVKTLLIDPSWSLAHDWLGFMILKRQGNWVPASAREVTLGNVVQLLGYDWAPGARGEWCFSTTKEPVLQLEPGGTLRLALYWRALQPMTTDYTVFTHLVGDDGAMVGQHDGPPGSVGRWPDVWLPMEHERTTCWRTGQVLRDVHYLMVDPTAIAQRGTVQIGWYDPTTGQRLATPDGETCIVLGSFATGP